MKNIAYTLLGLCVWIWPAEANSSTKKMAKDIGYEEMVSEADRYMADYDATHAMHLYEKALETRTEPRVIRNLSKCYFSRGYYRESLRVMNRMPSDSISHRDLRLKYDCFDYLSMPDSALAYGRIIADKYIYDSENIANIASYFNSIDQSDSALIYTKRYLDVDSTNMFVNRQQAYAYYNGKKFQKAMEEYARLINMGDSSLFTTFRMGLCCNGCDSLEKAFPYFLKAGKLSNFQNPNILTQLGKSCIVVGRVDDGIEYLSQALSTAYRSLDVLFILNSSLADGYFNKHDYRLTISHLKQALTYNNASYATLFKLGQAYELNNQMKEAKLTYQSLHETLANIDHPSASVTSLLKLCDERLFLISKMNLK